MDQKMYTHVSKCKTDKIKKPTVDSIISRQAQTRKYISYGGQVSMVIKKKEI
jgi:hypothetical protein